MKKNRDLSYPWKAYVYEADYGFAINIGLGTEPDGFGNISVFDFSTKECVNVSGGHLVDQKAGLRLNARQAYALYLGLNDFYSKQKGFSTPESELVGELRATKYHLQDMRKIAMDLSIGLESRRKR